MAFSEFEQKKVERAAATWRDIMRPPAAVRTQLDLDIRVADQSVQVIEVAPDFRDPTETIETPAAKATYVKKNQRWKIYWMRSDLKWHAYMPEPEARTIDDVLAIVHADKNCCFFG
ncbi:DUF3024 domain-containing protein [Vreelandella jeotgali]|uniref:DUF3024 domain-containing protein n=1 Tax=Vreelandella jeotgali TaxID=553386 RepID=UPI000346FE6A|nr:DUF3024 domain-containing protein [Halomonas jeotgali]